ncbi:MAG TPA: TMEM175 family protein, partial [Vicinamibacterales bacterium]|nr:TMEM175 family protein [Vicinamibacterales bacterium]
RIEAFSDGVIAILITIMVLELRVPHGVDGAALRPLLPTLLAYVLSFVQPRHLHLLFWLSLVPFTTAWMGENYNSRLPTAVYGVVLLMASIAYFITVRSIIRLEGPESKLAVAVGTDRKGRISTAMYVAAVALAFVLPLIADLVYVSVALMWLVPDRRIERRS